MAIMEDLTHLKILVVDDEPMLRDAIRFDIEMLGCKVLVADGSNEAKRILNETSIDLIVSDIRMPNGDGIDLLRYVRQNWQNLPMFLMSGFADIPVWDAYDLGADAYLGKPFAVESLELLIKRSTRAAAKAWNRQYEEVFPDINNLTSTGSFTLGRGGFFLENAGLELRRGTVVRFSIGSDASAPDSLEGIGLVCWVRSRTTHELPPGCGIEFLTLAQKSFEWVCETLAREKPTAFIPKDSKHHP